MTLLCVCGVESFIPELEHWIEKLFQSSWSILQKEAFEIKFMDSDSWNVMKWGWIQLPLQRKNFPDEITWITWITWKTKQNLQIWLFLKSLLEKWFLESGQKIDPATGVKNPLAELCRYHRATFYHTLWCPSGIWYPFGMVLGEILMEP